MTLSFEIFTLLMSKSEFCIGILKSQPYRVGITVFVKLFTSAPFIYKPSNDFIFSKFSVALNVAVLWRLIVEIDFENCTVWVVLSFFK
ncbi:hypothetical protein [Mycoplasma miroungirhinis]|uniref:Uncharacterized protein n=1 Tax=Mycoplasma miroungirhinis TaxID=754516 RepID=A0A6M4JCQ7_9MOLU|nr:hypothetical protein [Mycoplasma miroungirhinis]QJR44058.1 hypothetical protein HLA92_01225 [Mycoplasma miroungirhinis]